MPRQWFHLIVSTYGSWRPGDPRGFRTRHHREHVEGDYTNPPPEGQYVVRQLESANVQEFETVVIPTELRPVIGAALRDRLMALDGRVLTISVGGQHAHVQVQLETEDARLPLGAAKRHAWFVARDAGWSGTLWGKRPKVIRIRSHKHQRNVYRYILDHREEGAWVWSELEAQ